MATAGDAPLTILIVDDEDAVRGLLRMYLSRKGHVCRTAADGIEALESLEAAPADLVLSDLQMPRLDGLGLLKRMRAEGLTPEVAIISAHLDIPRAVTAFRFGACDIVEKPFPLTRIDETIEVARGRLAAAREAAAAGRPPAASEVSRPGAPAFGTGAEFVGRSPASLAIRDMIARVGPTDSTVLIEGETGVGKEIVARAIHEASPRRAGPFVPVNCGALPESLVEAQLFGHEKGAFTGATGSALGLFRAAAGGTLFLDEVGELPRAVQAKLLRALQEREVVPVGSARPEKVDVRIIAASNRDLEAEVREERFRRDLLFRLNVVKIEIPPLAKRPDDIEPLVESFIARLNARYGRRIAGIEPDALAALRRYPFPGNARELENLIERAYALGASDRIRAADLPTLGGEAATGLAGGAGRAAAALDALGAAPGRIPTIEDAKAALIERALQAAGGNLERAAAILGISSKTISRRRKKSS